MPTWFITGYSTGLGRAIAAEVLQRGWNAVITARDASSIADLAASYPGQSLPLVLDVTKGNQIEDAVTKAKMRFGSVDVLVNNAGYGYRSAVEEADPADVEALFATNFFGPIAVIKAVLPDMRRRRRGAIINMSSIAGRGAAPGSGYYAATKFALEGMSDALRKEVGPLGIKVMVVEPGPFRTDFAGRSLHQSAVAIDDYAQTAGKRRKENETAHGRQPGDPARGAALIVDAIEVEDTPFRLLLGSDAVRFVSSELDTQRAEIEAWRARGVTTDFSSP